MKPLVFLGILALVMALSVIQVHNRESYPNLESRLYYLSICLNWAKCAAERGLYYTNGMVRVEIELEDPDTPLPKRYRIKVERRYEALVQALVPVNQLRPLSNAPGIKEIRAPLKPLRDGETR